MRSFFGYMNHVFCEFRRSLLSEMSILIRCYGQLTFHVMDGYAYQQRRRYILGMSARDSLRSSAGRSPKKSLTKAAKTEIFHRQDARRHMPEATFPKDCSR